MLVFACISPHPPIILPNVGSPADRKKVGKTIGALESLAPKLAKAHPEFIIISSPHPDWGVDVPWFFLGKQLDDIKYKICDPQHPQNPTLDKFLTVYPILTTSDSPQNHYAWGKDIASRLKDKRLAWIASGDMSHRLCEDGPYGFHTLGPKFDKKFIELLKAKDIEGILNLDPELVEGAGECGLRSFYMMLGALTKEKTRWQSEILSYEGPFGVGYLVAEFKINS